MDAVERQLAAWNATPEVLKAPGGPLGGEVYRIATNEIGVWITVHRPRGLDIVSLFLTNAEGTVRLDFEARIGQTCEPEPIPRFPAMKLPPDAFTDDLLKEILAEDDRLVVAVHTPSVVVFSKGHVSAPLPGFRNRDAYRVYLGTIFRLRREKGKPQSHGAAKPYQG